MGAEVYVARESTTSTLDTVKFIVAQSYLEPDAKLDYSLNGDDPCNRSAAAFPFAPVSSAPARARAAGRPHQTTTVWRPRGRIVPPEASTAARTVSSAIPSCRPTFNSDKPDA